MNSSQDKRSEKSIEALYEWLAPKLSTEERKALTAIFYARSSSVAEGLEDCEPYMREPYKSALPDSPTPRTDAIDDAAPSEDAALGYAAMRSHARQLERELSALNTPSSLAKQEPVMWWNGFRKPDEHGCTYLSVSETEDTNHDIPLYSGVNQCNLSAPSVARTKNDQKMLDRLYDRLGTLHERLVDTQLKDTQEITKELHALEWAIARIERVPAATEKTHSPTPRTDAFAERCMGTGHALEYAGQLERELAHEKDQRAGAELVWKRQVNQMAKESDKARSASTMQDFNKLAVALGDTPERVLESALCQIANIRPLSTAAPQEIATSGLKAAAALRAATPPTKACSELADEIDTVLLGRLAKVGQEGLWYCCVYQMPCKPEGCSAGECDRYKPVTIERVKALEAMLRKARDAFRTTSSASGRQHSLPIEVVSLLSTAALHLRTWATSSNKEPYRNSLDVAERLEAFVRGDSEQALDIRQS